MRLLGAVQRDRSAFEADTSVRSRACGQSKPANVERPDRAIDGHAGGGTDMDIVIISGITAGHLLRDGVLRSA